MIKSSINLKWNGGVAKIQGKKVIRSSIYEIGLVIEGQAKELAPKDTGRLAASITTQSNTEGTKPSGRGAVGTDIITKPSDADTVFVGTPVEYAIWNEWGTRFSDAQPFMRPSLALAQGQTLHIVEKNSKLHFKEYMKP